MPGISPRRHILETGLHCPAPEDSQISPKESMSSSGEPI